MTKRNVVILGASGYTGAELLRLALDHPGMDIKAMTADRHAGKPVAAVFPQFHGLQLPDLQRIEEVDWNGIDAVFCCLPHGTTQDVISDLYNRFPQLVILDLSADFRLSDVLAYARWYGEHRAPSIQQYAVYGLVELQREAIRQARLVAVPGCYPTLAQLVLVPLVKAGVIVADDVIVDAKSGVTGAGRAAKEATLFSEVADGFKAYSVAAHRHSAEIEQGMGWAGAGDVFVNFTPHLVPMNRGILESIYVRHAEGQDHANLRQVLEESYRDEPFIQVLPEGVFPQTQHVRGTNQVRIGLIADRIPGRTIIVAVEDNLTKGASGQAVQNFNVVFGYPETTGLTAAPLFP